MLLRTISGGVKLFEPRRPRILSLRTVYDSQHKSAAQLIIRNFRSPEPVEHCLRGETSSLSTMTAQYVQEKAISVYHTCSGVPRGRSYHSIRFGRSLVMFLAGT
jgi:hypothetical protein